MKKILFPAALLIALFLTPVYAQIENQKSEWQRFEPAPEEFSVELPQAVTNKSYFDDKGALAHGLYKASLNETYFFVHSDSPEKFVLPDALKQFMRAYQPKESVRKIGNFSGAVYTFTDDEEFYHKILEVKAKNRAYIFHAISENETDEAIERFFDSIRFLDKPGEKPQSQTSEKGVAPEKTNKAVFPATGGGAGSGNGSGSGDGTGMGNGIGTGSGSGAGTNSTPAPTSGVKISAKPRANYTDLARAYEITGSLRVRVTFLANGQLGAITPVKKLPLGLTKNAIEAARKIRFEPAVRNGVPYSVTKIVEYNFMLF